jgi:hypothetical protein
MRTAEKTLNLFWIALGLAVAGMSPRYVLFDASGPGGGFLPFLAGIILSTCGCVLLRNASADSGAYWPRGGVLLRMGTVVVGLAAITLLMPHLGFVLTVIPVMMVLMQAIERQSWVEVLAISVISTLTVYFLFTRLLGTALPRGLLDM